MRSAKLLIPFRVPMNEDYRNYVLENAPAARQILESEDFRRLLDFPRHVYTNTYDHCLRVAVCMIWLSEKTGVDVESAVKIGLLHDLCYVNYYQKNDHPGLYCFYHPEEAADNAGRLFGLTQEEDRAIRAHMFPLSLHLPTSRLAFTLIMADKLVASYEVLSGFSAMRRRLKAMAEKRILKTA